MWANQEVAKVHGPLRAENRKDEHSLMEGRDYDLVPPYMQMVSDVLSFIFLAPMREDSFKVMLNITVKVAVTMSRKAYLSGAKKCGFGQRQHFNL